MFFNSILEDLKLLNADSFITESTSNLLHVRFKKTEHFLNDKIPMFNPVPRQAHTRSYNVYLLSTLPLDMYIRTLYCYKCIFTAGIAQLYKGFTSI